MKQLDLTGLLTDLDAAGVEVYFFSGDDMDSATSVYRPGKGLTLLWNGATVSIPEGAMRRAEPEGLRPIGTNE